jgi:hypothetical protein
MTVTECKLSFSLPGNKPKEGMWGYSNSWNAVLKSRIE